MVGDSRHDLQAGRAAGMVTLGVLTGPATAAELADVADAVLPDIGRAAGLARRTGRLKATPKVAFRPVAGPAPPHAGGWTRLRALARIAGPLQLS